LFGSCHAHFLSYRSRAGFLPTSELLLLLLADRLRTGISFLSPGSFIEHDGDELRVLDLVGLTYVKKDIAMSKHEIWT
jgi:hypothetical protein